MNKRLYDESIILIGPSGAGKSTIANELCRLTGMRRLCLDSIANKARETKIMDKYKSADEFNHYMIARVLNKVKEENVYGIVDFGAGHSVFDDKETFDKVKSLLKPFKNIVLLLPSEDIEQSLNILEKRSTGNTKGNRKFIESSCNQELATMIIYENNKTPEEVALEILRRIKENKNS